MKVFFITMIVANLYIGVTQVSIFNFAIGMMMLYFAMFNKKEEKDDG